MLTVRLEGQGVIDEKIDRLFISQTKRGGASIRAGASIRDYTVLDISIK